MTPRRNGGFTLLEVLAGMAIFALIAAAAYASLRSAARIWEAVDARARAEGEVRLALDYLGRHLSGAFPLAVPAGDGWRVWFEGNADEVTFIVEGQRHVGMNGLYQMTVRQGTDFDSPGAVLVLQPVDEGLRVGETHEGSLRRMLVEDAAAMEFAFSDGSRQDEGGVWLSEWHDMESLPRLVRVRLRGAAGGEWPESIVRLPADGLQFHRPREEGT